MLVNQFAIVLDGYVRSYPNVNGEITGGRSSITGLESVEEAKDLANILKSGKMPAPAVIIAEDVVESVFRSGSYHQWLLVIWYRILIGIGIYVILLQPQSWEVPQMLH